MSISFSFTVSSAPSPAAETPEEAAGDVAIRDLDLDPLSDDITLVDGDVLFNFGVAAIASDLASRWRTFKGEYFLDLTMGVDYWGVVFVGKPDLGSIETELRREALATPGVSAVSLQLELATGRELNVSAQITADTGLIFGVQFDATVGV